MAIRIDFKYGKLACNETCLYLSVGGRFGIGR